MNSKQFVGGVFVLRKCKHTENILNKYIQYTSNYHFIDDSPSIIPNDPQFIEHRHDQSVLSLLSKIYGSEIINDETYTTTDYDKDGNYYYPIKATRLKY